MDRDRDRQGLALRSRRVDVLRTREALEQELRRGMRAHVSGHCHASYDYMTKVRAKNQEWLGSAIEAIGNGSK
jgi:ribosome modulation factor